MITIGDLANIAMHESMWNSFFTLSAVMVITIVLIFMGIRIREQTKTIEHLVDRVYYLESQQEKENE